MHRTYEELLSALNQLAASAPLPPNSTKKDMEGFLRSWCREEHLRQYFDFLNGIEERKFAASVLKRDLQNPVLPFQRVRRSPDHYEAFNDQR